MNNHRIVVSQFGGPGVLRRVEEPLPRPAAGEARIRVFRAGVALADAMRREGVYPGTPEPPFTPGYDVVGEVDAVGEGVSDAWIGRKVVALTNGIGGYARYICLPGHELVELPDRVDPGEAVSLALNYVTAWQMLHRFAGVRGGQSILIHGAAGGVGTALLELGKLAGLRMFGTASAAKHHILERFGAVAIDYRSEDFAERVLGEEPEGVHAVFDPIGGENWRRSFRTLRKDGVFVGYGFTSILSDVGSDGHRQSLLADWRTLSETKKTPDGQDAHIYSLTTLKRNEPEWYREDLKELLKLLAEGRIKPIVAATFPLREAASAHEYLGGAAAVGKILLDCEQ
jgi:NADPH:quinone reductase and related Zn-dependent oxidoreductases